MIQKPVGKVDGMAACLGRPLYVEDFIPRNVLRLKIVQSPHAFARIENVDTARALQTPGVVCVLTYEDVPQNHPITLAAEAAPEGSTHDRVILERTVRFVGEPVAVVVAETEEAAEAGARLVDVTYQLRTPHFDYETAIDDGIPLYGPGESFVHFDNGHVPERNIIARKERAYQDVEAVLADCDVVEDVTVRTQAQAHVQAETHRTYCYPDEQGRLVMITSCQSVFNTQRIIAEGLGIPAYRLRVIKPKVGGAFGGKNTSYFEGLVAAAVLKTNRPCALVLSREESMTISNTRHAARSRIRLGATRDGTFRALDIDMLINGGAHGEHSFDVLNVGGGNTMPIYRCCEAERFTGRAAYTNLVPAGAFRGFGAPQVVYGLEAAVSDLAWKLGMDPCQLRLKNIIHQGEKHPFLSGGVVNSSRLEELIRRGRELIGWEQEYPSHRIDDHTIQAVGMAIAMHGSGIGGLDSVNATVSLNYDGSFTLFAGACDLGTGGDTILLQIASQALNVDMERVQIEVSDTKTTPYDKGAYASSTTYVTGNAVKDACEQMLQKIGETARKLYGLEKSPHLADGELLDGSGKQVDTLEEFAHKIASISGTEQLTCTGSFKCPSAPPPYVAGFVKLRVDVETGKVTLLNYVAMVDCGTVINPNLARVQVEGGIAQCMGYALYEDMQFGKMGQMLTHDLQTYRIPCSMDVPPIQVEFLESFEPSGPYGAKSIGEVTFHTAAPAIREALLHATGCRFNTLPITPEKILAALEEQKEKGGRLPC